MAVLLWQFCCYSGGGSAVLGRNPNLGDGWMVAAGWLCDLVSNQNLPSSDTTC